RFTPLKVGESAVAVGYGEVGTGDHAEPATRLQNTGVKILALGPASNTYRAQDGQTFPITVPTGDIESNESTCFGDSGGPLFDQAGQIVGVTSRGIDDACIDRPTLWTGLPQHEKLIRDSATTAGHPLSTPTAPTADAGRGDSTSPTSKDANKDDGPPPSK